MSHIRGAVGKNVPRKLEALFLYEQVMKWIANIIDSESRKESVKEVGIIEE